MWLNGASASMSDEGLGGASEGGRAGASEGVCEEELDVVFEERLVGVSAGESESVCGRGSDAESVGEPVRVGLGV